jgi:hypothetical protein
LARMASTRTGGRRIPRIRHSGSTTRGIIFSSQASRTSRSPETRRATSPSTSFRPSNTASQKDTPRRTACGSAISVRHTRKPERASRWATPVAISPPPFTTTIIPERSIILPDKSGIILLFPQEPGMFLLYRQGKRQGKRFPSPIEGNPSPPK